MANQTDGGNWFNGDDVVVLRRDGTVLDVVGQIGFDPGSEWGNGDSSTQNNTLRRHETNCQADNNGADLFNPMTTWVGYPEDSFADLGQHTTHCILDAGTDLIISEYIEGDNDNKALEIYNGTGAAIDLTAENYTIEIYFNGSTTPTTIDLQGSVNPNEVFVLAHSNAAAVILAETDQTDGYNLRFNGNDAVVLRHDGVVVDVIGQVGFDPSAQWGSGDSSTTANTLRRRPGICTGDTIATDAFLPAETWLGFPLNTFDDLGSHETDCTHTIEVTTLSTTVITYQYDELYRLTDAHYRGDIVADYGYAYDVVGNRTSYTASHSASSGQALTSTVVTTYTYNDANHLETAKASDDLETWHYAYDGNGNRVRQVPDSLTPAEGETKYTFNQAGQMVRVENHDGISYTVQVDIDYTGLGHRVQGTTYLNGTPLTVTYTLDGMVGQPLVIANSAETTLILYGQYAIGEYKIQAAVGEQWQYYLGDAELSVRQLVDDSGMVLLARTYAPYGILLTQTGSGASLFGYAGGQSGVSGLWYFGSGYFDPQTGQFLAQETNPLTPLAASVLANPGGLLFGPLMLWNWRRRKKGGKLPPAGLFVLVLLFTVGLIGCAGETTFGTAAPTPGASTLAPTSNSTRVPLATVTRIPTAFPTATVVKLTIIPDRTLEPGITSKSALTLKLMNDPQPILTEWDDIVVFLPESSVTSTPTPTPTPDKDEPESSNISWQEYEKEVVRNAANKVADKLAYVIKLEHPSWDVDQYPNKAFLMVYGGDPVTFNKTGDTCMEDTGAVGCWAETQGRNEIFVFEDATIIEGSASIEHWVVHELGLAFVWGVGEDPITTLDIAINGRNRSNSYLKLRGDPFMGRPTGDETWGFAGEYPAWQNSKSDWTSEVFADMFVGWVYDSWQMTPDENGDLVLHIYGKRRAVFMDIHMPTWVEAAITNEN